MKFIGLIKATFAMILVGGLSWRPNHDVDIACIFYRIRAPHSQLLHLYSFIRA